MKIIQRPSPNHDARPPGMKVDVLVMHYTGMKTAEAALQRLCDPAAKVSSHYTVDEDGTIYAHVPEDRRARHAGVSWWRGASDINSRSIGIEIVNPGHEFGYRAFPTEQIDAVIALSKDIFSRHSIPARNVVGHSDVAPDRKQDPGELFPWQALAASGIGLWHDQKLHPPLEGGSKFAEQISGRGNAPHRFIRAERANESASPSRGEANAAFENALRRYGYGISPDTEASLEQVIIAFQRHFRPGRLDGKADAECESILAGLLAKLAAQ